MRITLEIDDKLMAEAMKLLGAKSKREAVETALREAVKHRKAARAIRSLYGKVEWEGDLDAMRRDPPLKQF
jgi:Arc/MetJ family transcription regulator